VYTGLTAEDNISGMDAQQISAAATARNDEYIASHDALVALTAQTGGLLTSHNDVSAVLRDVVDDGDGYYLIGYQPESSTFEEANAAGTFHKIRVRVKRPGLRVRSRTGFFGATDDRPRVPETRQTQIARALSSPFSSGDMRVKLTTLFSHSEKEGSSITALLYFDAHDLMFTEEGDGSRKATIDVVAFTFDADGRQVEGYDRTIGITLTQRAYEEILKTGLVSRLQIPIKKPGAYQMRVALRDAATRQLGSASQFIEVPDVKGGKLAISGIVLAGARAAADNPDAASDPRMTPAVRIFKSGAPILFAYEIINAKRDRGKKPQIETQTRIFHDGKEVYSTSPALMKVDGAQAPARLAGTGQIQFKQAPAGDYVIQVIFIDNLAKKNSIAAQAMVFEIQ
jgi:hypothetical protein